MATLSLIELEALWDQAGGLPSAAPVAAAIAMAESSGVTTVIANTAYPRRAGYHAPSPGAQKEYSVGLWQINLLAHPQYTEAQMLDPAKNAAAAIAISGNGSDFGPWSTYTSGAYKAFLISTQAAASLGAAKGAAAGKPKVTAAVVGRDGTVDAATAIPASVTGALQGAWHAAGTHLPDAINRNRAARKRMLRTR